MAMRRHKQWAGTPRVAAVVAVTALLTASAWTFGSLDAFAGAGGSLHHARVLTNKAIFDGAQLEHATAGGGEKLTQPDDITYLGSDIFVAFQNGVGPQGEASESGNLDSTVVELNLAGQPVGQWDLEGKVDGLTADPLTAKVIATANEDAHSSLYTIDPATSGIVHFEYSEPLPSAGGTDAISIYDGMVLISASAPGTTGLPAPQPAYPAVYRVTLEEATDTAVIQPLFFDEASATVANVGSEFGASTTLALTDPDSNEDVPSSAPRFGGDFMLTSQGDEEQIFVSDAGTAHQSLSVLKLSSSVDDTAWPSFPLGALYVTDHGNDTVDMITGIFHPRSVLVADTPCDENKAPAICPAPAEGFPANFLGELDPFTGVITPVPLAGPEVQPQGMLFLP